MIFVTPDPIEDALKFAESRNWRIRPLSDAGDFRRELGLAGQYGVNPAAVGFRKEDDGSISKIVTAPFGPGDDFCAVWPLLDLLADGVHGWEPDYRR